MRGKTTLKQLQQHAKPLRLQGFFTLEASTFKCSCCHDMPIDPLHRCSSHPVSIKCQRHWSILASLIMRLHEAISLALTENTLAYIGVQNLCDKTSPIVISSTLIKALVEAPAFALLKLFAFVFLGGACKSCLSCLKSSGCAPGCASAPRHFPKGL